MNFVVYEEFEETVKRINRIGKTQLKVRMTSEFYQVYLLNQDDEKLLIESEEMIDIWYFLEGWESCLEITQ